MSHDEHRVSPVYLAGYDGSEASARAVAVAAQLAAATAADLVALTVYPRIPLALAPGAAAVADQEIEQQLREHAEELLDGLDVPGVDVRRALPGKPSRTLVEAADREGASLIAVGATHRGPLGRMAPGSVAERLLHGAPCPVLVVPADAEPTPVRTVGVAYDGSDEARIALHEARALAASLGADLLLLDVVEPIWVGAGWTVPGAYAVLTPEIRKEIDARLERVAAEAGAEYRLLHGDAGPSIVAACPGTVDLLVCGSRSYGPLRAVLAGSVSRHLVDHAPCPVLVVPRGARAGIAAAAPVAAEEAS